MSQRLNYSHPVCARRYSDEFFDSDVPMYLEHARRSGSPILELGCGSGRLLIPLAEAGFRVVGLDLYAPMLKAAQEKMARLDGAISRRINLVQADISRFSLRRRFSMAYISANTIFQLSRQKQRKCLECARHALKPGGIMLIDCESDSSMATAQECVGMLSRYDDYNEAPGGEATSVRSWITHVDATRRLMRVKTEVTERNARAIYNHELNWFNKDELTQLLGECGLQTKRIYGDWDMRRFSRTAHRMIFVAVSG